MSKRHNTEAPAEPVTTGDGSVIAVPNKVESKEDKFRRLANQRVNACIRRLLYVSNLANRRSYAYSDEQAVKICEAITSAANGVVAAFQRKEQAGNSWQL